MQHLPAQRVEVVAAFLPDADQPGLVQDLGVIRDGGLGHRERALQRQACQFGYRRHLGHDAPPDRIAQGFEDLGGRRGRGTIVKICTLTSGQQASRISHCPN